MKEPVDIKVRDRVRSNFTDNLFIKAGAGTGKTHSIVGRVVEAVLNRGIHPEKIAVMTFTEKAANELSYKIRRALEEKDENASSHVQKMFIGTIHSFCLLILMEQPLESGIDPGAAAMDEEEGNKLLAEIGEEVIQEYFSHPENMDLITRWEFDPATGTDFFRILYMYRDLEPVEPDDPGIDMNSFSDRHDSEFNRIPEILDLNETEDPAGIKWVESRYKEWNDIKSGTADEIISYFLNLRLLSKSGKLKSWSRGSLNGENSKSLLNYLLRPFEQAREEIMNYISYQLYIIYRDLYKIFIKKYNEKKNDRGELDFNDMLVGARELVKMSRESREYYQERFDLVVVDEFQDTDPVMSEMLMYICQDGFDDVPWHEVRLKPGKLTVVGDEKQSIYRFRRADISIFNRIKKIFREQGQIETLSQNFRSIESLVDNHNFAFSKIFGTENDDNNAVEYSEIFSHRGEGAAEPEENLILLDLEIDLPADTDVECQVKGDKKLRVDYQLKREAAAVSKWIKKTVENKSMKVKDGNAGYGDFMLLFSRRKSMRLYAGVLSAEGIPAAMDGEGFLNELPEVIDLFRLLNGSINPDNNQAVVSALRSVYCGISDSDLYDHRLNGGYFNLYRIDNASGNKNVNRELEHLKMLNNEIINHPPERGFRHIMNLEKVKYILNSTRKVMGLNVYDAIVSYIDGFCGEADSPSDVINSIMEDILDGSKLDPTFYPFRKNREVRMMTVHRAKGLESPVVILCDTAAARRARVDSIFNRDKNTLYFQFGLKKRDWQNTYSTANLYSLKSAGFIEREEAEKAAISEEDKRLIYVAATRAADYLVIPTYRKNPAKLYDELVSFYKNNDKYIEMAVGIDEEVAQSRLLPLPDIMDSASLKKSKPGIEKTVSSLKKSRDSALKRLEKQSAPVAEWNTFSHEKAMKRESEGYGSDYGTLFHRVMEIIMMKSRLTGEMDESGVKDFVSNSIDYIINTASDELQIAVTSEVVDIVKRHVEKAVNSEILRECFKSNNWFAEYPVDIKTVDKGINVYKSGIIDLIYKKDNAWKIVDYKTDKIDSDKHLSDLKEFYMDQLNGYVEAFVEITGEKAEGELLFVDELK